MSEKDQTESTKDAEFLDKSSHLIDQITDNIDAVIYFKDREGHLTFVNRSFEELAGVDKKDIKGKTPFDFFPREMAKLHLENDSLVMEKQQPLRFEEEAMGPDGLRTYVSTKFPL